MNPQNSPSQFIGKTQYCAKTLLCLILLFISVNSFSQQLAFPTAEGFGKYATGGRGGQVIKVTNLNNSGSGSFRAALDASGTRTIVFEVGGTINLSSNIYVDNGNITIAGQTAPGDGILIKGGMVQFEASNVIVRYIRFRPGSSAPSGSDAVSITAWSGSIVENVIFDHCSFSWADDENFNIRGVNGGIVRNVTVQNSIISENTYGFLTSTGCYKISIYRNLFALNSERSIRSNEPVSGQLEYEMINNLVFGFRSATKPSYGTKFSVVGNHYKLSSQVTPYDSFVIDASSTDQGIVSETYAYEDDNLITGSINKLDTGFNSYLETTPFIPLTITPITASSVEATILNSVGSSYPSRDNVDDRIINHYNSGNGVISSSGTYPTISNGTAPNDADNDGMPDAWETDNGLNLNNASDRNIVQDDGYTNLEYYLNFMTLNTNTNQVSAGNDVSICEGATTTLTASGADSYVWTPGNLSSTSIDVTPTTNTTYTVTGTHSNGSTTTDTVTVTVNSLPTANAGQDIETCQGTPVTLTANLSDSYLWSTSETTRSIIVNPNVTTPYTVEVTQNGCTSDSDEVVVTVNPLPNVDTGLDITINYGESTTLTANGADSYIWSTGETNQSITVNPTIETTYSVTGTIGTCQNTDYITVFLIGSEVVANAGNDQTICNGLQTTLTATGGAAYVWNTGATTASIDVTPSSTTTYTVTVYDDSGTVSDTDDVTVNVTEMPIANAGEDVEVCQGVSITLTASGGTSYLWNTGETSQSITVNPNTTTTYSVEVTQNNCSDTDETIVTINAIPNVDVGTDITIFEGETTTLTASGADTYLWNTGATAQSIEVSPTNTTTYSVTGYSNDCEATDDVIVTVEIESIVANAGDDVSICEGANTTLTATGGSTYQWNTGETTSSIDVNPNTTTTYSVTAFNALGTISDTDNVTVTVNAIPVANAGNDVEVCQGVSTTLTASGGTSYLWNTGETSQSITVTPNSTTTYSVEVTENNCSDTDETIVTINALPTVDAGNDVTIDEGETTTLTASGADTYLWNTGATTQSIEVTPNATTTYSVTGFSNGCEATDNVIVTVITENTVANAGEDVSICEGASTTLTASGGITYQWSTGETTSSINVNPNATTTYSVTAFNTLGTNSDTDDVTVTVNAIPIANADDDVEVCQGSSVTLTASGGTNYLWNTGATTQSITVTPNTTTTYSVEVTENNCSDTDETIVTVNALPTVDAGNDVTIDEGETTTLTASGANTYLWNTGATTQSIEVSPTNTTTYSVTGFSNGCEATDVVIVTVITENVVANAGDDVSICEGATTTLTATGGVTYQWNTGATTSSINVNPNVTTTYSVTVFNALGTNSDTDDVTVTVNALPTVNAGNNVTLSEGETTTLTASGADTYLWNTGATTQSIEVSPTSTTTYSVTGYTNDCEATDDITVTVESENVVANAGDDVNICEGASTILVATGGTTYQWNTGATTSSIEVNPNTTTTYSVTVFNSLGTSSDTDEVTVTVNAIPVANAGDDVEVCQGSSVILTASGGTSYLWNTGQTSQSITVNPNATITYSVEVTQNNCSSTDEVNVMVNTSPDVNAGTNTIIIEGESTSLTATGADTYLWSTGETTQTIEVTPLTTTLYSVTGFSNGCEATDEVLVTVEPFVYEAYAGEDQSICEGTSTTLTASEGDAYLWSTGETTQSITVNPWASETFTVTVFEGDEQAEDDVTVFVNLNPNVVIMNGGEVTILEGEFITLSASGANTYQWDNGATQPNIAVSPTLSRTYSVTGFINNCSDEKSVTVNVVEAVQAYAGEDLTICSNEMVTLTANEGSSGEEEYLWNNGATTQSIEVTPGTDTEYSVLVYNELSSDEATVMVYVTDCTPVLTPEEGEEFDVLIYQDASADVIKIKISGLDRVDVDQIVIYDITGKLIYREQIQTNENMQSLDKEIDSSQFSRGIYIVRLLYDDTEILKKIPIR